MPADPRVLRLAALVVVAACALAGCGANATASGPSGHTVPTSATGAASTARAVNASLTPALFDALRNNDMSTVRALIEKGADANADDDQGINLFAAVASDGNYGDLAFLVAHGAKPNGAAVRALLTNDDDDPRFVDLLLSVLDKNFQEEAVANHSLLMLAAENGHVKEGAALLKAGADINQLDYVGDPAVNVAAFHNQLPFAKMLVEAGARLDLRGRLGRGCVAHARDASADAALISYLKAHGAPE